MVLYSVVLLWTQNGIKSSPTCNWYHFFKCDCVCICAHLHACMCVCVCAVILTVYNVVLTLAQYSNLTWISLFQIVQAVVRVVFVTGTSAVTRIVWEAAQGQVPCSVQCVKMWWLGIPTSSLGVLRDARLEPLRWVRLLCAYYGCVNLWKWNSMSLYINVVAVRVSVHKC